MNILSRIWAWLRGERTHYTVKLFCQNCLSFPSAQVPVGTTVSREEKLVCPVCGCLTASRFDAY